jgi:hypothetical protein
MSLSFRTFETAKRCGQASFRLGVESPCKLTAGLDFKPLELGLGGSAIFPQQAEISKPLQAHSRLRFQTLGLGGSAIGLAA